MKTKILILALALVLGTLTANSQSVTFGETEQLFPHFAVGGGYATTITIHNPTEQVEIVNIEMFRPDGTVFSSQTVTLRPAQTQTIRIAEGKELTVGWARLSSTERFSATLLYQFFESGRLVAQAGVLPAKPVRDFKVIGTARRDDGIVTGLAIANPNPARSSTVTLRRLNAGGSMMETRSFALGPLQQVARLLHEDPLFRGLNNYEGMIEISATEPLAAVNLRLEGPELATVAAVTPVEEILTPNSVTTAHLADGTVTAAKVAPGSVVKSINTLKDDVTLVAGSNITITPSGTTLTISGNATAADGQAPIGSMVAWAGPAAGIPSSWFVADGRRLDKGNYPALFDKIGTSWGGDGAPNFYLPDLRGMFLRGVDRSQDGTPKGEDPQANERASSVPPSAPDKPGNAGNSVGSIQRGATAQPARGEFTTDNPGNHTHLDPTWNGAAGPYELATTIRGPGGHDHIPSAPTSAAGAHVHRVIGGDVETRPENAYVYWIIRVR
jgi:hypothetical protein